MRFRLRPLSALVAALAGACAPAAHPAAPPSGASRAPAPEAGWPAPALPPAAPVPREEYARRRHAVGAAMGDGVLVVFGAGEGEWSFAPFAQAPAFRYLTGVTEPDATLVMVKSGGAVRAQLFVMPRDASREVWDGARLGVEGARALTGIPARDEDRLMPVLDSLLARHRTLYTLTPPGESEAEDGATLSRDQQVVAGLARRHPGTRVVSLEGEAARLRASKSPAELDLLRRAAYVTALAQRAAMRSVEPGMNEFEVQAVIEYTFRRHGADRPGFGSIVGSGPNSTTLHYRGADRFMQAGETLVMDVGAAYRGYTADVTRTVPVSGAFSPEQRAVYDVVLAAQKAAEASVRSGATTLAQLNATAARAVADGLARLGLIEAADATYDCGGGQTCPQYRLFYMHGVSHGIGLEVHDPENSYFGPFAVGSAFTIEPGIYVRGDALDYLPDTPANRAMAQRLRPAVQRFRDVGVRIEDDYVITASGVERISAAAPREPDEVEALMRQPAPFGQERRPEVVEWYRGTQPR